MDRHDHASCLLILLDLMPKCKAQTGRLRAASFFHCGVNQGPAEAARALRIPTRPIGDQRRWLADLHAQAT